MISAKLLFCLAKGLGLSPLHSYCKHSNINAMIVSHARLQFFYYNPMFAVCCHPELQVLLAAALRLETTWHVLCCPGL